MVSAWRPALVPLSALLLIGVVHLVWIGPEGSRLAAAHARAEAAMAPRATDRLVGKAFAADVRLIRDEADRRWGRLRDLLSDAAFKVEATWGELPAKEPPDADFARNYELRVRDLQVELNRKLRARGWADEDLRPIAAAPPDFPRADVRRWYGYQRLFLMRAALAGEGGAAPAEPPVLHRMAAARPRLGAGAGAEGFQMAEDWVEFHFAVAPADLSAVSHALASTAGVAVEVLGYECAPASFERRGRPLVRLRLLLGVWRLEVPPEEGGEER
jgi:hypothetical protein